MPKRLTKDEFIVRAKKVHGNEYGYSDVVYVNNKKKIKIWCKKCNKYFLQTPSDHLYPQGCGICNGTKKMDVDMFVKKILIKHPKNKYKYNYTHVVYINNKTKVEIYCNIHKCYFWQKPTNHLKGNQCPKCKGMKLSLQKTKTKEDFIYNAMKIHGDSYSYNDICYINRQTKIKIWCKKCGKHFTQTPNKHLQGHGCIICCESKGEKEIAKILNKKQLLYISQKKYIQCKDIYPLPFDFYLPDLNICIEYQGKQHYEKVDFTGKMSDYQLKNNLNNIKKHDKIKKEYCKNNNITLIEIPYWDFNKIDEIISNINTLN